METIKRGRLANLLRGKLQSRHRLWRVVTAGLNNPQREQARASSELLPFATPPEGVDEASIEMFYDHAGELARFSWRKTSTSKRRKVRTPPHPTAMFELDDSALVQVSSITPRQWELEYKLVKNLTPGNQGCVDIYQGAKSSTLYAVKKIDVCDNTVPDEVQLMKDYLKPHPNIIQHFGIYYDADGPTCNIIMEYCSGGDLHDFADHWLYTRAQNIPEMFLLHFIASMGEALGYLHLGLRHRPAEDGVNMPTVIQEEDHLPLLHRDIKLDNIFLRWSRTSYGMPEIVLGDFGGASLASRAVGMFGTPGYFPPEVRTYMHSPGIPSSAGAMSTASDIYTVAACLCYLLVWGSYAPERDMVPIFNSSSLRGWPLLLDLLQDCLKKDPEDRPDTMTLFDWAPVLQNRIQFLYEHNVRMPEGSWLQPKVVAAAVSVDAVPRRSLAIPESIYTATTPSADAWEFDDHEGARSISTLKGRTDRPTIQAMGNQPAVEQVRTRPPIQRVWSWTFRGRGERDMARSFSSANPTNSWLEAQRAWVDQLPRSPTTPTTRNHWPDNQPGNIVLIEATRELGSTHPSSPARLKHLWLGGLGVVPACAPWTHPSSSARVNDLWLPGLGIVPTRAPPTQEPESTHPSSSAKMNDLWLSGLGVVPTPPESMHPSPPAKMNDLWLPGLGVVPGRDSANSRPGSQPSKQRSLYSPKNSTDDKHVVQRAKAFEFRVLPLRPRRVTIRRSPPASTRSDVVERMASVVSRLSPRRSRRAVLVSRFFADSDFE